MRKAKKRYVVMIGVLLALGGVFMAMKQEDVGDEPIRGQAETRTTQPRVMPAASNANIEMAKSGESEGVGAADDNQASNASAPKKIGHITPLIDWEKYSGTLGSQVNMALESRDGAMAMDLAANLFECITLDRVLSSPSREVVGPVLSGEAQAGYLARKAEDHRLFANCQTVAGGYQEQRQRLLELALEHKVVGAGYELFALGWRRQDVVQGVAADAAAGDVRSLIFAVSYPASTFNLGPDSQAALRYGFELASRDEAAGALLQFYYDMAQRLADALGFSPGGKFDNANISPAAKAQGEVLAARILRRLRSIN